MLGGMLLALMLGNPAAAIVPAPEIRLADRAVRIGDVARLSGLPDDAVGDVSDRVVARIPHGRDSFTLSRTALAALIRRAVPALEVSGSGDGTVTLHVAPDAAGPDPRDGACYVLALPVVRGETLTADHVSPADCREARPEPAIVFDRREGAARAAADLAEGFYLGPISLAAAPDVARGEALTLASRVGPVTIERSVVAVQPGRAGGRIFVMTEDGEVLVAAVPATSGEGGE